MQIVINVPDNLSLIRVKQIVEEMEQKLKQEAELATKLPQLRHKVYAHLITVDNLDLPSRDELYDR
jgi:meiotically up-regulated gene 157 (Mug157) protein